MKILLLFCLISCSHRQYQVHKTQGVGQEFKPYLEHFEVNHSSGKKAQSTKFPINFSPTISTVGVCYLRAELKDREVLINPVTWQQSPEKRQYIMNYLLSACYGLNPNTTPQYEFHLNKL